VNENAVENRGTVVDVNISYLMDDFDNVHVSNFDTLEVEEDELAPVLDEVDDNVDPEIISMSLTYSPKSSSYTSFSPLLHSYLAFCMPYSMSSR
jgi:hypothetical protein